MSQEQDRCINLYNVAVSQCNKSDADCFIQAKNDTGKCILDSFKSVCNNPMNSPEQQNCCIIDTTLDYTKCVAFSGNSEQTCNSIATQNFQTCLSLRPLAAQSGKSAGKEKSC